MGRTIAEKILGQHAGYEVKAGDFVLAKVDVMMGNDGSLPLIFEASRKMIGLHEIHFKFSGRKLGTNDLKYRISSGCPHRFAAKATSSTII